MPSKFNPAPKDCLTFKQVAREIRYEPSTGHLFWHRCRRKRKMGKPAGCLNHDGYRKIRLDGTVMQAHRVAWLLHFGRWPSGFLDHINGNRDDNRIENLREATHAENVQNRKVQKTGKALPGAYFRARSGRYESRIQADGSRIHLGTYDTEQDAHQAYLAGVKRYHRNDRHTG